MPLAITRSPSSWQARSAWGSGVLLGATTLYWFAALLSKWDVLMEDDPIQSGRLYTFVHHLAAAPRCSPHLAATVGAVASRGLPGRGRRDRPGWPPDRRRVWNPVLAGWTYAGDLLVWGALAVSFPDYGPDPKRRRQRAADGRRWRVRYTGLPRQPIATNRRTTRQEPSRHGSGAPSVLHSDRNRPGGGRDGEQGQAGRACHPSRC